MEVLFIMMTQANSTKKAWLAFIIFFLTALFISGNNDKVSATMVLLIGDLGIGTASAGLLITVAAVIGGIAAIPVGAMMVKTGPRTMGLIAILLAIIGCVIGALLPHYGTLMVSRIFDGVAMGTIATVVPTVIASNFPEEKRGLPMGIWSCYVSIGYIIVLQGAAIVGDEANPHTWVNIWWALAIAFVVILALFLIFTKNDKNVSATEDASEEKIPLSRGFKSATTVLITACMVFLAIIVAMASSYMPTYCNSVLGLDILKSNSLTSLMSISMLVSGLVMGVFLNKVRNHKAVFLVCAILTAILGLFSFLFPQNIASIYMIVLGFFPQAMFATLFTLAPSAAESPETVSVTMGLISFGQLIAGLAVTAGGMIIDMSGFATCSYALGAVGICLVIFTIFFYIAMKRKEAK